jgi:hypothetical protein
VTRPTETYTLYTNGERYFIVPDDAAVAEGPLWMIDVAGNVRSLDPEEAATYEVTEAEADAFMQREVDETAPKVIVAMGEFLMMTLEASTLPREELRELVKGMERTYEAVRTNDQVGMARFRQRTQRVALQLEERDSPELAELVRVLPDYLREVLSELEE